MAFWKEALRLAAQVLAVSILLGGLLLALEWLNRSEVRVTNREGFSFPRASFSAPSAISEISATEPILLEPAGLTRERVERIKAIIEKLKQETLLLEKEETR